MAWLQLRKLKKNILVALQKQNQVIYCRDQVGSRLSWMSCYHDCIYQGNTLSWGKEQEKATIYSC